MAQDIAELGISVDSSGVEKAKVSLDELAQSGERAEQSAQGVTSSWSSANQSIGYGAAAINQTKIAYLDVNAAIEKQKQELTALLGKIDPVTGALNRLREQQEKLSKFRTAGVVDEATFQKFSTQIENNKAALTNFSEGLDRAGVSAKQTQAALRQLPAQFTDIFVSLQAGQSPLTVFLQQGAQIKDSFGGIGPALRETATFARGLITPFSAAAVAVGGLALAWKQGVDESQAFAQAIATTGNAAGVTVGELNEIAAAIDGVAGTQAKAAEALTLVVQSASFTKDQLQVVAQAAIELEAATGRALESTIEDFRKLAKDPVDASLKLAETSDFLTAQLFEQIDALQRQGREAEAAAIAIDAYAEATRETAAEVESQLNPVIRAFNNLFKAAKEAWDEATGVGRGDALSRQLEDVRQRIQETLSGGPRGEGLNVNQDRLKQLRAEEQALLDQQSLERAIASEEAENRRRERAGQEALRSLRDDLEDAASPAEKLRKALEDVEARAKAAADAGTPISDEDVERLKELERARFDTTSQAKSSEFDRLRVQSLDKQAQLEEKIAQIRASGAKEGRSQAEIEQVIANARAKFAESQSRASTRGATVRDDAATRLLLNLREQQSALELQLSTEEKLTRAETERAKFLQQIADLQSKDILTAEQKSLLAAQDSIKAQLDKNVAIEREIALRDEALKFQDRVRSVEEAISAGNQARRDQQTDLLGTSGLGKREREIKESFDEIRKEYARYKADLAEDQPADVLNSQAYRDAVAEIDASLAESLENQRKYYEKEAELRGNARAGFQESVADYISDAEDLNSQVNDLTSSALGGLEDAFVDLATTGKANFKDLADSIIADIVRIGTRLLIAEAFQVAGFSGGATGGGGGASDGQNIGGLITSVLGLFAGGRANGGPVSSGRIYEVGENNMPELLMAGGRQYLIPGNDGNVVPSGQMAGGNPVTIGSIVLPGISNRREAREAGAVVARQITSVIASSARYA